MTPNERNAFQAAVKQRLALRLAKMSAEYTKDLKAVVGVPAVPLLRRSNGEWYTPTRATPGSPPRRISGRGRASIGYDIDKDNLVSTIFAIFYMGILERKGRWWVMKTWRQNVDKYTKILGVKPTVGTP